MGPEQDPPGLTPACTSIDVIVVVPVDVGPTISWPPVLLFGT